MNRKITDLLQILVIVLFCIGDVHAQRVVLEKRKAGNLTVLVSKEDILFGATHYVEIFDKSSTQTDELTFTINQSSDQGCSESISGEYAFIDPILFKITRNMNNMFCGVTCEDPTSANDISKEDFLKVDDPYEIIDRNTVTREIKTYSISAQGKIKQESKKVEIISDKIYGLQKLDWLPKKNLRILRNSIFAKYGYKFKAKDLQGYFAKKTWYKPTLVNVDKLLTPADKEVIAYLMKLESE